MSTNAVAARIRRRRPTRSARGVDDALAVTWRKLVALRRTPQRLVFATIALVFVLLAVRAYRRAA